MVSTDKALGRCQELTEELCRLGVPALRHVGTSQHVLRSEAVLVPGGLAPVPLPQGFRQAQFHRAGVLLLARRACIPARVEPESLVLGSLDAARHVRAPRFCPAPASALDGQRRAVVVQADAAAHGLLARLLVAAPLPVLALAARVAVERLLAAAALLPVLVAGRGAGELLAARRARHCASLPVIRCSDVYRRSRTIVGAGGRCGGVGRGFARGFLRGLACQRGGRSASMNLCIAAVGCCTRGALALGGGAFLLRAGETRGCFVAPAHHATHGKGLARRCTAAVLLVSCPQTLRTRKNTLCSAVFVRAQALRLAHGC